MDAYRNSPSDMPMLITRSLLLPTCLALAAISSASSNRGVATILPEVKKHLAAAHKYVSDGTWDYANAHADLILIADDVSICVNFDNVSGNQKANCMKALQAALTQWQASLDQSIHFHIIDDVAKADLRITFRPDVRMGKDPVAGLTNWTRSIHSDAGHVTDVSFKADMQVRTRDLDFHTLSFEAMRQETEHEFGHVLGLDDSDHLGDLMGEFDCSHLVNGPKDFEVQAVKNLREEAKRIKADVENKQKGQ